MHKLHVVYKGGLADATHSFAYLFDFYCLLYCACLKGSDDESLPKQGLMIILLVFIVRRQLCYNCKSLDLHVQKSRMTQYNICFSVLSWDIE